jgi:hypothetical protein
VTAAAPVQPVQIALIQRLLLFVGAARGLAPDVMACGVGELVELLEDAGVESFELLAGDGRHAAS